MVGKPRVNVAARDQPHLNDLGPSTPCNLLQPLKKFFPAIPATLIHPYISGLTPSHKTRPGHDRPASDSLFNVHGVSPTTPRGAILGGTRNHCLRILLIVFMNPSSLNILGRCCLLLLLRLRSPSGFRIRNRKAMKKYSLNLLIAVHLHCIKSIYMLPDSEQIRRPSVLQA